MKLPPPEVLALWPIPNYANPTTRGPALIVVNSVFLSIATTVLVLRIYTRIVIKKWFGWDDIFICAAFICTVGMNVIVDLGSSRFGWDRHIWDVSLKIASSSQELSFWGKIVFLLAGFFTSCSLLAFYYRLSPDTNFRLVLHISNVFNVVAWLPFIFAEIFICVPVQAYWQFPEPDNARCIPEGPVTFVGCIVKTFVDLLLTTIPIPIVLRLNLQRRQRYGVAVLLGLGYIVTAAGAVRTYYTWRLFTNPTGDKTWDSNPTFLAAAVENNLAIICASVPTIRPLLPRVFGGPISRIRNWVSSNSSRRSEFTLENLSKTRPKEDDTQPFNTALGVP